MSFGKSIDELIEALRVLPGVGQKSAQRMALYLLEQQRIGAQRLSEALHEACEKVGRCSKCRHFSESSLCGICGDEQRDGHVICVVESSSDLIAIEQTGQFKGHYYVLSGSLSPIDGRGPAQVGIPQLVEQVTARAVNELILATNPTLEGEATAQYIADSVPTAISVTRLAHGIPLGGELGYVDGGTLSHAFSGRKSVRHD